MRTTDFDGWGWFQPDLADAPDPDASEALVARDELPGIAARCFRRSDGKRLLMHLRQITVERGLAPGASEAVLRHLEGQRQLVKYLEALVADGRAGRAGPTVQTAQQNYSQGDDK